MNTNGRDFIMVLSCNSCVALIDIQGKAAIWPIINPTIRIELTRNRTRGEDHRLLLSCIANVATSNLHTKGFDALACGNAASFLSGGRAPMPTRRDLTVWPNMPGTGFLELRVLADVAEESGKRVRA